MPWRPRNRSAPTMDERCRRAADDACGMHGPAVLLAVLVGVALIDGAFGSSGSSFAQSIAQVRDSADCKDLHDGDICSMNGARVCRNRTCISACEARGMRECKCDLEEDNYCYLCCGNDRHVCQPAHAHNILRPNGERWERDACARCRQIGHDLDGLPCDDKDAGRLCLQGKCTNSICHDKQQGAVCDRKMEKICVDNECRNPCASYGDHLMVCDCPMIDPDTGFASDDRCQLCCFDFNVSPSLRRCQNAYRRYGIVNAQQRPVWRVGVECAGGKTCNRYGACAASSVAAHPFWLSVATVASLLLMVAR